MFQSLTVRRSRRPFTQPLLSFALHAAIIYAAVRGTAAPGGGRRLALDPVPIPIIFEPGPVLPGPDLSHAGPISILPARPVPPVSLPDVPGTPGPDIPLPGPPQVQWALLTSQKPGTKSTGVRVQVFTEDSLTDPPVPAAPIRPAYPPALRGAGVEGNVEVSYVVGVDGRVEPESFRVLSTTHPGLVEPVRVALDGARFQPGRIRGRAVRVWVRQTVRFELR